MAVVVKPNQTAAEQTGAGAVMEAVDRLTTERAKLKEKWQANNAAWLDAVAAGRLFGVAVTLPADIEQPTPGGVPRYRPRIYASAEVTFGGTIREDVIDQLKQAGKSGIKAADIRREIEKKRNRKVHDKTIGMTLYRLSLKGKSRRDGITWFWVSQGT